MLYLCSSKSLQAMMSVLYDVVNAGWGRGDIIQGSWKNGRVCLENDVLESNIFGESDCFMYGFCFGFKRSQWQWHALAQSCHNWPLMVTYHNTNSHRLGDGEDSGIGVDLVPREVRRSPLYICGFLMMRFCQVSKLVALNHASGFEDYLLARLSCGGGLCSLYTTYTMQWWPPAQAAPCLHVGWRWDAKWSPRIPCSVWHGCQWVVQL